jgi:hypothetical protein
MLDLSQLPSIGRVYTDLSRVYLVVVHRIFLCTLFKRLLLSRNGGRVAATVAAREAFAHYSVPDGPA